jgi:HSP20 family molecular chaperone IbpA
MGSSQLSRATNIRLCDRFSEAFNQFQEQIRERAYQLSQIRDPAQGGPLTDWLEAQAELSEPVHVKVKEQRKNTVVEVKLRDFEPEEIEIEVAGHVLQIFGSHSETTRHEKGEGNGATSKTQTFFQCVSLPVPVDLDHSHAKLFKNGTLKVVLPKKPTDPRGACRP